MPHLLTYNAAKFTAVGFSEGIAAELRKDNIYVTTIVSWLMPTGSYLNAFFPEGNKKELKLFAFSSTAPLMTISGDEAARRIIKALKSRRAFKIVGLQAKVLNEIHHSFPNLTIKVLSAFSRFIPAEHREKPLEKGKSITERYHNTEIPVAERINPTLVAEDLKRAREFSETCNDHWTYCTNTQDVKIVNPFNSPCI